MTVTAAVAEDISATTAKVQLFQAFDSDPENNANAAPVSCDHSGTITWVMVAQSSAGDGSVDYTWTPSAVGHYGFKAHCVKGNSDFDNLTGNCYDLNVTNASSGNGPTVTASLDYYDGGDNASIIWTICAGDEEMTNVTIQGIIIGYGYYVIPSPDIALSVDNGQLYGWTISSIPAGECVTREIRFTPVFDAADLTTAWTVDFDTPSHSGQQIVADPVAKP